MVRDIFSFLLQDLGKLILVYMFDKDELLIFADGLNFIYNLFDFSFFQQMETVPCTSVQLIVASY